MSKILAEENNASTIEQLEETIDIKVTVDAIGNVTVDKHFVRILEGASATITWTIDSELSDVFFDNPGISMFGERAPMVMIAQAGHMWQAMWENSDPANQKRSFPYRIHLVRKVGTEYYALRADPIIHNDPPPAP